MVRFPGSRSALEGRVRRSRRVRPEQRQRCRRFRRSGPPGPRNQDGHGERHDNLAGRTRNGRTAGPGPWAHYRRRVSLSAGYFGANPWPFTETPPLPLRGRPRWHTRFNTYDIPRVMALYAEHASLESPAILAIYPHLKDGILRGRSEIGKFF